MTDLELCKKCAEWLGYKEYPARGFLEYLNCYQRLKIWVDDDKEWETFNPLNSWQQFMEKVRLLREIYARVDRHGFLKIVGVPVYSDTVPISIMIDHTGKLLDAFLERERRKGNE